MAGQGGVPINTEESVTRCSRDDFATLEACREGTYDAHMLLESLFRKLRRNSRTKEPAQPSTPYEEEFEHDPDNPFPDVVTIEFQDVLDLHSIPARQVRAVVEDYLEEARRREVRWVRIIHGKGIGVQREIVRSILSRTSYVVDFQDAPADAGGWGATIVSLRSAR